MTLEEFNEEKRVLQENIDACKLAKLQIEAELATLDNVKSTKENKDELIKIKSWVNVKYFLNDDMLKCLRVARDYLIEHKEVDCVYDSYVNRYIVAAKQYVSKCKDAYYLSLANKYIGDITAGLEK